jgi:hypothetical protein
MFNLKDLLPDSMRRAHITGQVTTARIIEAANRYLKSILPPGRHADAEAISIREGILAITCLNAAASHLVSRHESDLRTSVLRELPTADLRGIRTRVGPRNGGANGVI